MNATKKQKSDRQSEPYFLCQQYSTTGSDITKRDIGLKQGITYGPLLCRFAELWDEEKADLLVDKVDFTTVDADFVKSLGDKVCQLPTSALLKIPKTNVS